MADQHNTPKGNMHSNCGFLPDHIVCKITQRNSMKSANTCDPAINLLNEEIISDIHKQPMEGTSICTLGSQVQHTYLWKTIHGYPTEQLHPHSRDKDTSCRPISLPSVISKTPYITMENWT